MENNKKIYENPKMEVVKLGEDDIILTSNTYFYGEEVDFESSNNWNN